MAVRKYEVQVQAYQNNPIFCIRNITNSKKFVEAEKKRAIENNLHYKITNRRTGEVIENTYPDGEG